MPESEDQQLQDQLQESFPAPRRFGWVRFWRHDSSHSLGLAVAVTLVLLVLVLWMSRTSGQGASGPIDVAVETISLEPAKQQELNLSEPRPPSAESTEDAVEVESAPGVTAQQALPDLPATGQAGLGSGSRGAGDPGSRRKARQAAAGLDKTQQQLADLKALPIPDIGETGGGGNGFRTASNGNGTASKKQWHDYLKELRKRGLDVIITFDSTGSMSAAIHDLKQKLLRISTKLIELVPNARVSLCTYRDHGDAYVVKGIPLTNKIPNLLNFMHTTGAGGGGDAPEAVLEGLQWAREQNRKTFKKRARTVIIVFGDAPPHAHTMKDCLALAQDFRRKGGVISAVTIGFRPLVEFSQIAHAGGGTSSISGPAQQVVRELLILAFGPRFREHILREFRF